VGSWATRCLPAVRGRACVGAWAGEASGGSFGASAPVAVWAIARLLRWGPVLGAGGIRLCHVHAHPHWRPQLDCEFGQLTTDLVKMLVADTAGLASVALELEMTNFSRRGTAQ